MRDLGLIEELEVACRRDSEHVVGLVVVGRDGQDFSDSSEERRESVSNHLRPGVFTARLQ